MFDIKNFKVSEGKANRYKKRIDSLISQGKYTEAIQKAVSDSLSNIKDASAKSFVIYGDPQSGKTEMMIALTAKLLDEGFKIIIVLLNDNVELLNQNLERFRRSGIDPSPKNFNEILDPSYVIGQNEWVIFCKKNSKDLSKLIEKLDGFTNRVIIDDEADYASPNSKVNKGEQTKINSLIENLLSDDGIYIGVTATPGRLDLNNTFNNENSKWVDFPPHPDYTGQSSFFPTNFSESENPYKFYLDLMPDSNDDPKYLRDALFSFFVNVAQLNITNNKDENYSMLIHTSGKTVDHSEDYKLVIKVLNILKNTNDEKFDNYVEKIWNIAKNKYSGMEDEITRYIVGNIASNLPVIINSDKNRRSSDITSATNPAAIFTIAIGGNIISRGVTFDSLLSMFFTRDVKHKIQQDTYIQRARMFGSRNKILKCFSLHIPEQLYLDWHKCFVFHKLSLDSIRMGQGAPVWLEDYKVRAVSASSIDKTTMSMDSGEMRYEIFDYDKRIDEILESYDIPNFEKLIKISELIGEKKLPTYLLSFIKSYRSGDPFIVLHPTRLVDKNSDYHDTLDRKRGLFGGEDTSKFPEVMHHVMIHKNTLGKARVVYKYSGNIRFIKNQKGQKDND